MCIHTLHYEMYTIDKIGKNIQSYIQWIRMIFTIKYPVIHYTAVLCILCKTFPMYLYTNNIHDLGSSIFEEFHQQFLHRLLFADTCSVFFIAEQYFIYLTLKTFVLCKREANF